MKWIVILLFTPLLSYTQDYYLGYQAGFKYGCNCNDQPPRNVILVDGTYSQGYDAGKLDGVVYANRKNSQKTYDRNKPHQYSEPTYTRDYELIERALSEKQRLLDERRTNITYKVASITKIIERVKNKNGSLTQNQSNYIDEVNKGLVVIQSYDLSIQQNYLTVINWLNKIETEVLSWL